LFCNKNCDQSVYVGFELLLSSQFLSIILSLTSIAVFFNLIHHQQMANIYTQSCKRIIQEIKSSEMQNMYYNFLTNSFRESSEDNSMRIQLYRPYAITYLDAKIGEIEIWEWPKSETRINTLIIVKQTGRISKQFMLVKKNPLGNETFGVIGKEFSVSAKTYTAYAIDIQRIQIVRLKEFAEDIDEHGNISHCEDAIGVWADVITGKGSQISDSDYGHGNVKVDLLADDQANIDKDGKLLRLHETWQCERNWRKGKKYRSQSKNEPKKDMPDSMPDDVIFSDE
jgi:hypothetical protein